MVNLITFLVFSKYALSAKTKFSLRSPVNKKNKFSLRSPVNKKNKLTLRSPVNKKNKLTLRSPVSKKTNFPTRYPTQFVDYTTFPPTRYPTQFVDYITFAPTTKSVYNTDISKCAEWNCKDWCLFYEPKFEKDYIKYGCIEDGDACIC